MTTPQPAPDPWTRSERHRIALTCVLAAALLLDLLGQALAVLPAGSAGVLACLLLCGAAGAMLVLRADRRDR